MGADNLIGTTIGPYEILEKIGQGGMAEVYKGHHPALRRMVAIKFLGRNLETDENLTTRFQREAQAIAALRHSNIIQVYDFGTYEGGHYLVMEYIDGRDLRQEMDSRRKAGNPLNPDEILQVLEQVAQALDYAHQQGIIHRDIKPGNILLDSKGQAFLGDFGLAMLRDRVSQATLGNTFGTPEYIAPEQAIDSRATVPQSDIYALGGIIYEMVTGKLLFEADTPISLALKHVHETPLPPREHDSRIPQSVENVILRALSKDPTQRQATAQTLVDDLRRAWAAPTNTKRPRTRPSPLLHSTPPPPSRAQATSPTRDSMFPPAPKTYPKQTLDTEEKGKRRKLGPLVWILLGLAIGLSAISYLQFKGDILNLFATATATATATQPAPTITPTSTTVSVELTLESTPTPSPFPTNTPTPRPTQTPNPTPTPTLAPGESITRELDSMRMHFVSPGLFTMGAAEDDSDAREKEMPAHEVTLGAYWIDETEVSTDQFRLCVTAGACEAPYTRTNYDNPSKGDHPMTLISWEQASTYCQWVAQESGWDAHLPTEAQWEKAASWDPLLNTKRIYPWGNTLDSDLVRLGSTTASASSYPEGASAYGVLNLAGNVWEWVGDWYDDDYYASESFPPDPSGPEDGTYRVFRGGAYDSISNFSNQLRTTYRELGAPESTSDRAAKGPNLGFRCAVTGERLP